MNYWHVKILLTKTKGRDDVVDNLKNFLSIPLFFDGLSSDMSKLYRYLWIQTLYYPMEEKTLNFIEFFIVKFSK